MLARLRSLSLLDRIALGAAVAVAVAILVNALLLQTGPHPAPIFAYAPVPKPAPPPQALPSPRTGTAKPSAPLSQSDATGAIDVKLPRPRPVLAVATVAPAKQPDMIPARAAIAPSLPVLPPRPSAPVPPAPRNDPLAELISPPATRVAALQRVLAEWGYGQLRPTGVLDAETQAAIAKFERERNLPVTGQASARVVRELAAVTGQAVD